MGEKRDEEIGGWRKLHNEELHNFYSPPRIIRTIKSRRIRWEGHVARIGRMYTGFWRKMRKSTRSWEDIIKIYFRKIGFIWLLIGTSGDPF
jgi:hypothetical protein